jgi:hypothetical protein
MVKYWEHRRLWNNLLARRNEPSLSGYPVCLVYQVSFMQLNKPDKPNRPNEQDCWWTFSASC